MSNTMIDLLLVGFIPFALFGIMVLIGGISELYSNRHRKETETKGAVDDQVWNLDIFKRDLDIIDQVEELRRSGEL